jgi:hypothetical protein
MKGQQFVVARGDLRTTKVIETDLPGPDVLQSGGLLLEVERFAFTANNITYAMLGDGLKYWQLFPAPQGFGIIPVWGFGEVLASRHPDVAEGERLFGYFPMASHLVINADGVSPRGLRDGAPHRQGVAPIYNAYARVSGDAAFAGRRGDYQALLRPLFMLSFLVDDFLAEANFFGADSVILTSASSKTALGLAHLLRQNSRPVRAIGLTSAANVPFVESLGCYQGVVAYDDLTTLRSERPVAIVDMAGNPSVRARLHRLFGDHVTYSGRIGLTHQDAGTDADDLPGAKPTFFFAPDQVRKRAKDWGPGGVDARFAAAWATLEPMLGQWLDVVEGLGAAAVEQVYRDTLDGRVQPDLGHMLSLTA